MNVQNSNIEKVDVIINVYGKPWQTLCTLKSLIKYNGEHIDKIYFIEEKEQPYNDNVKFILEYFDNIIHYIPEKYQFLPRIHQTDDLSVKENRYNFRYQYGIENSDKKYVFITHNDVLYTGNIVWDMLNEIDGYAGIGSIGQCWNCPCKSANECNGDKFHVYNPTYEHVIELCEMYKPARGDQFISMISKDKLKPLPECRLNEFSCLINREISVDNCIPIRNINFFGDYSGIDIASAWFKGLIEAGFKFKNYNIDKNSIHSFYSKTNGYSTQLDNVKYKNSENFAKEYYYNNLI